MVSPHLCLQLSKFLEINSPVKQKSAQGCSPPCLYQEIEKKNTGAETIRACGRGTRYPRTKIQFDKCKEPASNIIKRTCSLKFCALKYSRFTSSPKMLPNESILRNHLELLLSKLLLVETYTFILFCTVRYVGTDFGVIPPHHDA